MQKTSSQDHLTFKFLLEELQKKRICYVHTGNFNDAIIHPELDNQTMTNFIRSNFNGNVIASGSYTLESALEFIKKDKKNLIAFGRPFIANPDLIEKIKSKIPWEGYSKKCLILYADHLSHCPLTLTVSSPFPTPLKSRLSRSLK